MEDINVKNLENDNLTETELEKKGIEFINQLEELTKTNTDLLDRLKRNMAEFDNFRKRTQKEKTQMYDDGVREVVEKILPVIDNFERAIGSFENQEDSVYKGFTMINKQLNDILFSIGVECIESIGTDFSPIYHNAIAHIEDDSFGQNQVIEEMQKGYKYKDKIIRCSMVKVAN